MDNLHRKIEELSESLMEMYVQEVLTKNRHGTDQAMTRQLTDTEKERLVSIYNKLSKQVKTFVQNIAEE